MVYGQPVLDLALSHCLDSPSTMKQGRQLSRQTPDQGRLFRASSCYAHHNAQVRAVAAVLTQEDGVATLHLFAIWGYPLNRRDASQRLSTGDSLWGAPDWAGGPSVRAAPADCPWAVASQRGPDTRPVRGRQQARAPG